MRSSMTLISTQARHHVPAASRISGHNDAMWCTPMGLNPFAYATKRRPRPKELFLT
jgi:hypothetical protein